MGRVRITRPFVLLALAVLLSPPAEASRTSVWERNPPAAVDLTKAGAASALSSLAPADDADVVATEPPRFDLGDVVFIENALEHEDRFDLGPLDLLGSTPLRGPPSSYPETRVGGFELLPPFRVGASASLSLWSRQACGFSCREVASDSRYDPWGLCLWLDNIPCSEYGREFGNQFRLSNLWGSTKRAARFGAHEVKGAALAIPRLVKSAVQVAAHPIKTIRALGTAVGETIGDPGGTAHRVGNALLNADPDRAGEFAGETLTLVGLGAVAKTTEGAAALGRAEALFGNIRVRGQLLEDAFKAKKLREGAAVFETKKGRMGLDLGTVEQDESYLNELKFVQGEVGANDVTSLGLQYAPGRQSARLLDRNLGRAAEGANRAELFDAARAIETGAFRVRFVGGPRTTFDQAEILARLADRGLFDASFETVTRRDIARFVLFGR